MDIERRKRWPPSGPLWASLTFIVLSLAPGAVPKIAAPPREGPDAPLPLYAGGAWTAFRIRVILWYSYSNLSHLPHPGGRNFSGGVTSARGWGWSGLVWRSLWSSRPESWASTTIAHVLYTCNLSSANMTLTSDENLSSSSTPRM